MNKPKQKILKEIEEVLTDFKGDSAFSDDVDNEYKKHLIEVVNQALDTMHEEGKTHKYNEIRSMLDNAMSAKRN